MITKIFKKTICHKVLGSVCLSTGLLMSSASVSALNIALTNDDGWDSVGIQALYTALTNAGHTVTLAGPLDGQSGSGAAINSGGLEIVKQAEHIFSVAIEGGTEGAEPATAAAIATSIASQLGDVDILISGINDGANVGAATQLSGTVGATIISIGKIIGESVPAIAISTDDRCETVSAECDEVANFTVDYLTALENRPIYVAGVTALLPEGVALNINYPPVAPLGVKLANQGQLPYIASFGGAASITIACHADCSALPVGGSAPGGIAGVTVLDEEDVHRADSDLFQQGYITVVPIRADYTAHPRHLRKFLRRVHKMFNHDSHGHHYSH